MTAASEAPSSAWRSFSEDDAWQLGTLMRDRAREAGLPICIDISRPTGTTLFHASLPGATVDNDGWAARKAAIAYRFEVSSAEFAERYSEVSDIPLLTRWIDLDHYAPVGGACPILIDGAGVVAVVAVSGLPGAGDHDFIETCFAEFHSRIPGISAEGVRA